MDKLYDYGLSELFLLIALAAAKKHQINLEFSHLDSSSFAVHGQYNKAKNLVNTVSSLEFKKSEIPGYSMVEKISNYGVISQRWLMVESEARAESERKSLEKKITKEKELVQKKVERGFAFLKDPLFFADSTFLKSPKRIETMGMLMGLCLMVYSLGQREVRSQLKKAKTGIPNQLGKLTERPTLKVKLLCIGARYQ